MKRRTAFVLIMAVIVQLFVGLVVSSPASAATGPADDRMLTTPTGWWTYTGATVSQISTLLNSNHARLTDLKVDDPSVPTFTVVMVANSGDYASGWWWYVGETQAQVSSLLTTNNARLISAEAYNTSGGVRYAVVMVPNTGADARTWWWYVGTTSQLSTDLTTNHARMIQVTPYPGSSTEYVAIMVDNTGGNALGWWWYVHESTATISTQLGTNKARLVDLSRNDDGTYNVVMYADTTTRWYWYVGQDPSAAVARAGQQGERIITATSYVVSGTKYYSIVETRNTNALSEKLWNIIGPVVDSGTYGFYLKKVGGNTLAGIEQDTQYEPASALKVLYHAYSIHQESLGNSADSDSITYHFDPADPNNPGICPDNFPNTTTTDLKNADQQMMWNSDNRMTRGILEKYGKANILNYGASLGLTSTAINHNIGCPTPSTHNLTTLDDLGRVYAAYANKKITTSSTWNAQFRSRMLNESNYSPFKAQICPIVKQVANELGKKKGTGGAFCDAITWIAKGGSYQYGGSFPYNVSWDGLSMTGLPYKTAGGKIQPEQYVFGEFIDETQINSQSEADTINAARTKEYNTAIRPYIKSALKNWP